MPRWQALGGAVNRSVADAKHFPGVQDSVKKVQAFNQTLPGLFTARLLAGLSLTDLMNIQHGPASLVSSIKGKKVNVGFLKFRARIVGLGNA